MKHFANCCIVSLCLASFPLAIASQNLDTASTCLHVKVSEILTRERHLIKKLLRFSNNPRPWTMAEVESVAWPFTPGQPPPDVFFRVVKMGDRMAAYAIISRESDGNWRIKSFSADPVLGPELKRKAAVALISEAQHMGPKVLRITIDENNLEMQRIFQDRGFRANGIANDAEGYPVYNFTYVKGAPMENRTPDIDASRVGPLSVEVVRKLENGFASKTFGGGSIAAVYPSSTSFRPKEELADMHGLIISAQRTDAQNPRVFSVEYGGGEAFNMSETEIFSWAKRNLGSEAYEDFVLWNTQLNRTPGYARILQE